MCIYRCDTCCHQYTIQSSDYIGHPITKTYARPHSKRRLSNGIWERDHTRRCMHTTSLWWGEGSWFVAKAIAIPIGKLHLSGRRHPSRCYTKHSKLPALPPLPFFFVPVSAVTIRVREAVAVASWNRANDRKACDEIKYSNLRFSIPENRRIRIGRLSPTRPQPVAVTRTHILANCWRSSSCKLGKV